MARWLSFVSKYQVSRVHSHAYQLITSACFCWNHKCFTHVTQCMNFLILPVFPSAYKVILFNSMLWEWCAPIYANLARAFARCRDDEIVSKVSCSQRVLTWVVTMSWNIPLVTEVFLHGTFLYSHWFQRHSAPHHLYISISFAENIITPLAIGPSLSEPCSGEWTRSSVYIQCKLQNTMVM